MCDYDATEAKERNKYILRMKEKLYDERKVKECFELPGRMLKWEWNRILNIIDGRLPNVTPNTTSRPHHTCPFSLSSSLSLSHSVSTSSRLLKFIFF